MGIEYWQQGQVDIGLVGGGGNLCIYFGMIGIGVVVGIVVQVMEFVDVSEVVFQYFYIGLGGDGLYCVWVQMGQEVVYQFVLVLEVVIVIVVDFGQVGYVMLKCVVVQVGQVWY